MRVHLDTHVALWLAAGEKRRLKPAAKRLRGDLFLSPVVIVEMEILREIGRIRAPVLDIMDILTRDHGIEEAEGDIREIGQRAQQLGWTRDPFDRFIVAHALAHRAILLTADDTIRSHCSEAHWQD